MSIYKEVSFKDCYGEKGLDFSYTLLITLNKFVKAHMLDKIINRNNLVSTLFNLYSTFVVYELGPVMENTLALIIDILEKLPKAEANRFVVEVVNTYLLDSEKLKKLP